MGDEADATIGQRIRLQVPHRPHPERVVHKTHAARSAQRHTGIGGDRRERVSQAVCGRTTPPTVHPRRPRRPTGRPARRPERRAVPRRRARRGRPVTARTAARRCGCTADSPDGRRTSLCLKDHARAETVRVGTGAHHRHRPGAEAAGGDRRAAARDLMPRRPSLRSSLVPRCDPHSGLSSGVHRAAEPPHARACRRAPRQAPANREFRKRRRRRACRRLPLYSPAIGVR